MREVLLCQAVAKLACCSCAAIATWATQQMHFLVEQQEEVWVIENPAVVDYRAAIHDGLDPTSKAIFLASVIAGPSDWPTIFPGLVEATRQEQKAQLCQIPLPGAASLSRKNRQGPTFL